MNLANVTAFGEVDAIANHCGPVVPHLLDLDPHLWT